MRRIPILFPLTVSLATIIVLTGACGGGSISAVRAPELRPAPFIAGSSRASEASVSDIEAEFAAMPNIRVGSFERPDGANVPEYEIIERQPANRDGARAARLLVDTRARTEAEYEFITRDIKARFATYDAVSVEFTNSEEVLEYKGAAVIFNTPTGATHIGFVYGPPNNRGYSVKAAE